MSIFRFFWKVWLRLNLLTANVDNDYTAEVSTAGKTALRNADLARMIKDEGSEFQYETLLDVLNRTDRIIRAQVQFGYSVLTGCAQFTPRVSGSWIGANAKFDPAVHKITLDIVPSAEMREALKEVGVEVLGVKDAGAFIGMVTDAATDATDGSITAGDDVVIEGDKLRIAPADEDGLGVFFTNADSGETTQVTRRLTQNDPKRLIARVPNLPSGEYTLRVVTRFSNSSTLLVDPRTVEYTRLLTVV